MLSVSMRSVKYTHADCHYAECRYAGCRFAECSDPIKPLVKSVLISINLIVMIELNRNKLISVFKVNESWLKNIVMFTGLHFFITYELA